MSSRIVSCQHEVGHALSPLESRLSPLSRSSPVNVLRLRDGAPSLADRAADLARLRAAILARKEEIEHALNADFGHRSRHETAMMEILPLVQGIDYLDRNLRRFMRPEPPPCRLTMRLAKPGRISAARRDRDHGALELSALACPDAAGDCACRR
jgi:hypothetical protein